MGCWWQEGEINRSQRIITDKTILSLLRGEFSTNSNVFTWKCVEIQGPGAHPGPANLESTFYKRPRVWEYRMALEGIEKCRGRPVGQCGSRKSILLTALIYHRESKARSSAKNTLKKQSWFLWDSVTVQKALAGPGEREARAWTCSHLWWGHTSVKTINLSPTHKGRDLITWCTPS